MSSDEESGGPELGQTLLPGILLESLSCVCLMNRLYSTGDAMSLSRLGYKDSEF